MKKDCPNIVFFLDDLLSITFGSSLPKEFWFFSFFLYTYWWSCPSI